MPTDPLTPEELAVLDQDERKIALAKTAECPAFAKCWALPLLLKKLAQARLGLRAVHEVYGNWLFSISKTLANAEGHERELATYRRLARSPRALRKFMETADALAFAVEPPEATQQAKRELWKAFDAAQAELLEDGGISRAGDNHEPSVS